MARKSKARTHALFWCVPWRCNIAPSACAKRYRKAKQTRGHGESRTLIHCEGCVVGKAHSKRQLPTTWPTGAQIDRSARVMEAVPVAELTKKRRLPIVIDDAILASDL